MLAFLHTRGGDSSKQAADRLLAAFADDPQVRLGGGAIASRQVTAAIQRDLRRAELIAFPLVLLLSFWVFRGFVASLLPPLVGAGAIALTFFGLRIAVEVHPLSVFALNLVTGLGLGLAIDYSLFIVSRWREEAARHGHGPEALAATMRSAGRTVVFSALTVAASMACLLVFPQQFLYSMGLGGVLVALAAGIVALVPLPAFLYWLGPRIDALAPKRLQQLPSGGRWARLAAWVMRRPGRVAAVSASVLIVLAIPALRVHFVGVDATTLPASASSRQVAEALGREDVRGRYAPITAITDAPPRAAAIAELAAAPGAAAVLPARQVAPGLWRLDILPRDEGLADSSQQLVHTVRAKLPDARVTGQTAAFVDQQASLAAHLPWALAILALTTCTLIFLFTGSVVLPLKSLIMNVLTLGAAFGILVVVFEWGRGLYRARVDPADSPLRDRLRPLHRLRDLPLLADQGGTRPRAREPRGGRGRDGADGAGRHRGRAPLLRRDRHVRDVRDLVHPGARRRHRGRGRARCDDHPGAARPQPDGAARRLELVGAGAAAPAPPAAHVVGGLPAVARCRHRPARIRLPARPARIPPLLAAVEHRADLGPERLISAASAAVKRPSCTRTSSSSSSLNDHPPAAGIHTSSSRSWVS